MLLWNIYLWVYEEGILNGCTQTKQSTVNNKKITFHSFHEHLLRGLVCAKS